MNTITATAHIRDTFHAHAEAAGLAWTGGAGAYSEFTGTCDQWSDLALRIRDNAKHYHVVSVRAAIQKVEWAMASIRARANS